MASSINQSTFATINNSNLCNSLLYDPCTEQCHDGGTIWEPLQTATWLEDVTLIYLFYGKMLPSLVIAMIVFGILIIIVLRKYMRNPANVVLLY